MIRGLNDFMLNSTNSRYCFSVSTVVCVGASVCVSAMFAALMCLAYRENHMERCYQT
jgi:hypothetical protein